MPTNSIGCIRQNATGHQVGFRFINTQPTGAASGLSCILVEEDDEMRISSISAATRSFQNIFVLENSDVGLQVDGNVGKWGRCFIPQRGDIFWVRTNTTPLPQAGQKLKRRPGAGSLELLDGEEEWAAVVVTLGKRRLQSGLEYHLVQAL